MTVAAETGIGVYCIQERSFEVRLAGNTGIFRPCLYKRGCLRLAFSGLPYIAEAV